MKRVLIIVALAAIMGCGRDYSNGSRIGIVTKLSKRGLIVNSWEGEMLMALSAGVAGQTQPEKFTFNVDPDCVAKVQDAMRSGKRVELVYRQWAISPLTIDDDHVVIDVKEVK